VQNGAVNGDTMSFDITWFGSSMRLKIIKKQEGGKTVYSIEDANGSVPWLFQGRHDSGYDLDAMPGYNYGASGWNLTDAQVEWFKTAWGLDIVTSLN
jgi:hypothetical protein